MQRLPLVVLLAFSSAVVVSEAAANELLVCRHSPARIESYSTVDGALINGAFVDIDGLLGLSGAPTLIWDITRGPNGELWTTNHLDRSVHRFSFDGSTYLGDLSINIGVEPAGVDLNGTNLAVSLTASPGGVHRFDLLAMTRTHFPVAAAWDVTRVGGQWLVGLLGGRVMSVDPVTGTATVWSQPGGICEQIVELPTGEIMVANFTNMGYTVHHSSGSILQTFAPPGVGLVRGVAQLENGNVMLSGPNGLFIFDPIFNTVVTLSTEPGAFIYEDGGAGGIGTNYCMANANSTGRTGALLASGSRFVSTNDVTLLASELPPFSFGFFIVSRIQGFVQNPGGSDGNLCLAGQVGRYVSPSQIQQSTAQGGISLHIDLTTIPQPLGTESVQPGETWNFQLWHRDVTAGVPSSNFSTGIEINFQ